MATYTCRLCFVVLVAALISEISCQSTTSSNQTTASPTTTSRKTTTPSHVTTVGPDVTTLTPAQLCESYSNTSCSDCLGVPGAKCLWCKSNSKCMEYPYKKLLPTSVCDLDKARWGVCWMNFEAMIISVSVIGGAIFLGIFFCCLYCCCCRKSSGRKYDREDARYNTQKMERKAKSDERKAERKERLDEIRRKYGLNSGQ